MATLDTYWGLDGNTQKGALRLGAWKVPKQKNETMLYFTPELSSVWRLLRDAGEYRRDM